MIEGEGRCHKHGVSYVVYHICDMAGKLPSDGTVLSLYITLLDFHEVDGKL